MMVWDSFFTFKVIQSPRKKWGSLVDFEVVFGAASMNNEDSR